MGASPPTPAPIRCGQRILRFDRGALLMGIINSTPDSFSDGGRFAEPAEAIDCALKMAEAGADLIDIGGESTRPGSEPVDAGLEIARVVPLIEGVVRYTTTPVSIDTSKASVAQAALEAGAAMINDVSACRFDPDMAPLAARAGVPLVLMHMRGKPKTMQQGEIHYSDLMGEILAMLQAATEQVAQAGVAREMVIWDPGLGFGKTPEHNLIILHRLSQLCGQGQPVLVGPSRKAFIGHVTGAQVDQRLLGTAAAVAASVLAGAHIVRVHDLTEMRQVASVASAIRAERRLAKPNANLNPIEKAHP
jgi:dihydropteroate synthase